MTKQTVLTIKEVFYSKLNDEHISDERYEHANKVWKTFGLKNMSKYHLYLLLKFRKTCLEYYKLDPAHNLTSAGLSWDAMLRMTGVELDLIND